MVRRPKYLSPARDGRERWLISYTDILTLLLILFAAMAAQTLAKSEARAVEPSPGTTSAALPKMVSQEVSNAPVSPAVPVAAPSTPTDDVTSSHQALVHAEARLRQQGLDLKLEARGLVISLPQAVLFASGDDRINASARPIISEIADEVRSLDNKIELAGHADSLPIHNRRFKNNWELSAARGLSLLHALIDDYGIQESRLTVSSHGSFSPKGSNDTADGRAENRRVEILILDQP